MATWLVVFHPMGAWWRRCSISPKVLPDIIGSSAPGPPAPPREHFMEPPGPIGPGETLWNSAKLFFFCLKMKRTPADLMSLSDDLLDWSRAFHFFNHPIHWSLLFILFLHHYIYPEGQHEPRSSAKLLLARPGATRGPLTICLPGKWYICIDDHQTNRDTNRLWEMNGDTSMTQSTLDTSWYIYDLWTLNLLSWIQIIGVRHKSDPKFMTLRDTSVDSPFIRMGAMPGSTLTCLAKNT